MLAFFALWASLFKLTDVSHDHIQFQYAYMYYVYDMMIDRNRFALQ